MQRNCKETQQLSCQNRDRKRTYI
ncbi:hypothetical protein C6W64_014100 [Blautia sp. SG-772]|nr:hypothetical protein C6W64_014100 [Blautia sp. SG-772]